MCYDHEGAGSEIRSLGQNPTETELQMLRCETEQRDACSQLRMQIGRLEVEAASRVEQLNKAREIQASLKVRETVPSSAGLNWHIAAHVIRGSSSRRGREIRHRGFPAVVFHSLRASVETSDLIKPFFREREA